jgi:hypothetical protein
MPLFQQSVLKKYLATQDKAAMASDVGCVRIKKKTEANGLQSEIDRTYHEIDRMVYELHGLTQEEI